MSGLDIKNRILALLKDSSLSFHDRMMIKILLPVMEDTVLNELFKTLSHEQEKLEKIDKKRDRVELKYEVLLHKVAKKINH